MQQQADMDPAAPMALARGIVKHLKAMGRLRPCDMDAIMVETIADLSRAGGEQAAAADTIRAAFTRPSG